jgi:DNA-directed RNA polymerase sigma subunit (sigma70/sigma32)
VARNIARRFRNRGENPDDIEQVASVGLVLAVDRFHPGLGFDFLSFAVPTITGEVQRHLRDRTNAIRVPRRLRALQAQIYQAGAELEQRNRRSARPSEIAERLGVELEVVIEGLAAQGVGRPGSLDEPDRDAEGSSGRLRFGSALGLHECEFDLIEYRQALAPLLAALSERERRDRSPPFALVGDGDDDAVAGAASMEVNRSRGVGVVGVGVFGGVGDRLVGSEDQVLERFVGHVEGEPRDQFMAKPGGILRRR